MGFGIRFQMEADIHPTEVGERLKSVADMQSTEVFVRLQAEAGVYIMGVRILL